jgi:hypothetical protein
LRANVFESFSDFANSTDSITIEGTLLPSVISSTAFEAVGEIVTAAESAVGEEVVGDFVLGAKVVWEAVVGDFVVGAGVGKEKKIESMILLENEISCPSPFPALLT